MKTTLVYPGIAGYGFESVGKGMEAGWISHGLAYISAAAKAKGFAIDLIDLRALRSWDHFREEIARRQPDVVGITMMSVDYNPAMRSLAIVKEVSPHTITVVGGPHPTLVLDEMLTAEHIDYIITNEGEITFPKLLHAIEAGEPPAERVLVGERPDLDALPFPDRELFLEEWRKAGYVSDSPEDPFVPELPPPFVTIIAGRGCRYNCSFCQPAERILFGRRVRRRSPGNVIAELEILRAKYHFRSLMFHDDTLTEDREWVIEFCRLYREHGFDQPFFCQSRADIIVRHEDMVKLMAEAGCTGYFIGFESGSDRVLRFIRKGTTRAVNLEAARVCRRYGIKIWANYMLGLPTETKDEVMETISMLKEINPDYYSPAFYTPHPGSDLYDYCIEHGLSLITSHDQYRRNPTEIKIVGQDNAFLTWALEESQRRKPINQFRRDVRRLWSRYARPRKIARKLLRLLKGQR
ncbi:MAG: B12-binding domain-containing radical SAM protein [Anaerolineae bacterium]|nr:B12-binding domain-containing radical SAM protein [Anaerolineae bacterium]